MAEGAEAGTAKLLLFVATECSHFFRNIAAAVSSYQETGVLPESLPASAPLSEQPKKKKGGRPRKDAAKDKPAKAKRKPSAFNNFVKGMIAELREENADPDKSNNEIFSAAVAKWKAMDQEDKKEYTDRFKAEQDAKAKAEADHGEAAREDDADEEGHAAVAAAHEENGAVDEEVEEEEEEEDDEEDDDMEEDVPAAQEHEQQHPHDADVGEDDDDEEEDAEEEEEPAPAPPPKPAAPAPIAPEKKRKPKVQEEPKPIKKNKAAPAPAPVSAPVPAPTPAIKPDVPAPAKKDAALKRKPPAVPAAAAPPAAAPGASPPTEKKKRKKKDKDAKKPVPTV